MGVPNCAAKSPVYHPGQDTGIHIYVYSCQKQQQMDVYGETNATKQAAGIPLKSASSHSISGGKNDERLAAGVSSGGRERVKPS